MFKHYDSFLVNEKYRTCAKLTSSFSTGTPNYSNVLILKKENNNLKKSSNGVMELGKKLKKCKLRSESPPPLDTVRAS